MSKSWNGNYCAGAVLIAIASPTLAQPSVINESIAPAARAVIRAISKDPDTLKFRNEFASPSIAGIYCGEVNGKNSFGGYVGFRRFIVQGNKSLLDDGTLPKFNQAWLDLCISSKKR